MTGLIVDNFAGGGGASTGIEAALGRDVDVAINHDAEAMAMHQANHPGTHHVRNNIWQIDPRDVAQGRPVRLAWFSPDCKHHSKAKGGRPKEKSIRDLAWVVVLWAQKVRPDVIFLENVEEFRSWGPLGDDGTPIKARAGETWEKWLKALRKLGYRVQWKELKACDYGAPTIRKRLYLIARRDGEPITWPQPTHGPGRPHPFRTAAECIDWSLPCPSIFLSKEEGAAIGVRRPLADATMARIARGVKRYVIDAAEPFIVTYYGDKPGSGFRGQAMDEPLKTQTTENRHALVVPVISYAQQGGRNRNPRDPLHTVTASPKDQNCLVAAHLMTMRNADKPFNGADEPTHTVTAGGAHLHLVSAFLAQHNTGMVGHHPEKPVSTIVGKGCTQGLVAAHLISLKGADRRDGPVDEPSPTITAGGFHVGEVRAFLMKYYGSPQDPRLEEPLHTVTTRDRFGLVMVHGEAYEIVDIGMRMLTPRELARAQGFPDSYILDPVFNGKPLSKTAQIRMIGNSVCPDVARAIVAANLGAEALGEAEAA